MLQAMAGHSLADARRGARTGRRGPLIALAFAGLDTDCQALTQHLQTAERLRTSLVQLGEFAGDVQESLYGGLSLNNAGIHNRGVKKAPFIVLIGANMPSILAEISFVSNPTDERKMETSEHRQRIAESLYKAQQSAGGAPGGSAAPGGAHGTDGSAGGAAQTPGQGDVVDAEFVDVDESKKPN